MLTLLHVMPPSTDTEETPIWPLFRTVSASIIQVILVSIAGYVLTRQGLLNKSTQKQLNVININFFTPCLLFSKVAFSLSLDKLKELWILPIFFMLLSCVSLAVAWLLAYVFRLSRPQRNFAMAASMIMNSNSLPVALLQSLALTMPGLEWGENDTIDTILERALTYILLCGTMGQFLRWSYGVHLLSKAVPPDEIEHNTGLSSGVGSPSGGTENLEELGHGDVCRASSASQGHDQVTDCQITTGRDELGQLDHTQCNINCRDSALISPWASRTHQSFDPEAGFISNPEILVGSGVPIPVWSLPPPTSMQCVVHAGGMVWRKTNGFMTPPLWASFLSIVVALTQPLQHVIKGYLGPVRSAVTQAGDCSIPITLVVLGAYFHMPTDKSEPTPSGTSGWQRASLVSGLRRFFCIGGRKREIGPLQPHVLRPVNRGEGRTILVTILARMFVIPVLLAPLLVLGVLRGSLDVLKDPVFNLSLVLLLASPPAVTLAQIAQDTSNAFERLISRTTFWSYCIVAPPAMVGYTLVAMLITKL
ncbi:auxin efflux carrier [Lactifluus subvellereus]|nr:auxin efflux carrier [Lactifluus subvellereus]